MQEIFDWCVRVLIEMSHLTGLSYEAINVILFVFLHPAITLLLLFLLVRFHTRRKSEKRITTL
jgi:hypothetical protein